MVNVSTIQWNDLKEQLQGELLTDPVSLAIYATDASLYQVWPMAVTLPKNCQDVLAILKYCNDHKITVLPRGAGTSLAGQTVSNSVIIDVSKYMNQILEIDTDEQYAIVEPGVVLDSLNAKIRPLGLTFAPDPATSSRANIGGMIANNSSGTKSILYGKTSDHVISLKVALIDGTILYFDTLNENEIEEKCQTAGKEGEIYRSLRKIIVNQYDEIRKRYPKTMRRVSGYALDAFLNPSSWNLTNLICGSEGTLGVILEAKLRLVELPEYKSVCAVHFDDEIEAVKAIHTMLQYTPSAVETLDKTLIQMSLSNLETRDYTGFMTGTPKTIQIVEFYGSEPHEVDGRAKLMIDELRRNNYGYDYPYFNEREESYHHVWAIRKKGLGLLLARTDKKKAAPFIEDAAIPLENLTDYVTEVKALCHSLGVELAIYGHASVGVLHLRPFLDFTELSDIEAFEVIARETFKLVKKYGGSWSSEHGDGRVRSPFVRDYYGDTIYNAFKEIKSVFDPYRLMNPGVILDADSIIQNMRYSPGYTDPSLTLQFKYRNQNSFHGIIHDCTGVGECRKVNGGTMCPSYRATLDEEDSTRGRANALRLAMAGQLGNGDLSHPEVLKTLDLCLSCKACKAECPSNVDMAKLKSEVLQMKYHRSNPTLRQLFIKNSHQVSRIFSGWYAPLINRLQQTIWFRFFMEKCVGIASQRQLPGYTKLSFRKWYDQNYIPPDQPIGTVVFFADTYVRYHDHSPGMAAIRLLRECGYHIVLLDKGCCQRPKISNGFLASARKEGIGAIHSMKTYFDQDIPVVACEPSCISALQEDLPDLMDDEGIAKQAQQWVMTVERFLFKEKNKGKLKGTFVSESNELVVHGHCHDKALYGQKALKNLLLECSSVKIHWPDTGCCGMAGSFGYEKEHYDLSMKIAGQSIIPVLAEYPVAHVIANGFSCRHQINDCTGRHGKYWAEYFHFERAG
ncbi:MAG TPA: FAD-linked oxidase C-terminal domain-containing protein [Saprospiraceae bacterium]|nr:FAD-linked oxidase C-terminal domain-containing protein [Saprospiraceae bacterium]